MKPVLPAPSKRMLTKEEAADYCGFPSVNKFVLMVRVSPVNYGNCVRYDRERLDEWLDTLSQSPSSDGGDIVERLFNEDRAVERS